MCKSSNKYVWNSVTSTSSMLSERRDAVNVVLNARITAVNVVQSLTVHHDSVVCVRKHLQLQLLLSVTSLVALACLVAAAAAAVCCCCHSAEALQSWHSSDVLC